jgi:aminoglycoside phosphotransferase family enzyme
MTRIQIDKIAAVAAVPGDEKVVKTIETLVSWVLVCKQFTYKIKRPVRFPFLDYSNPARRKNFCLQECYLNRRLAKDMYVDVLPVTRSGHDIRIDGDGEVIDYAIKMKTIDEEQLMDVKLARHDVALSDVEQLASMIAHFHLGAEVIYMHAEYHLTDRFKEIAEHIDLMRQFLDDEQLRDVSDAMATFEKVSAALTHRLIQRVNMGFFRDCHGDLHTGNIFLTENPLPFDCIEFDDSLRKIDVLNEIAFLCMDLEVHGEAELSQLFFETYNSRFPAVLCPEDEDIFILYKAYRANVLGKINMLKGDFVKAKRYIKAMKTYIDFAAEKVMTKKEEAVI